MGVLMKTVLKNKILSIKKLVNFAKDLGITVYETDSEELNGAGALYVQPDAIYVPKNTKKDELILLIAHELGHAVSERRGEVHEKQEEVYLNTYPSNKEEICLGEDAKTIRYIEARAVYHAEQIIKRLKIKIKKEKIEEDSLYCMLALEQILICGQINSDDTRRIWAVAHKLISEGKSWKKLYKDYL